MKQQSKASVLRYIRVALRARAWIETSIEVWRKDLEDDVALRARAWIETVEDEEYCWALVCRPPREGVD